MKSSRNLLYVYCSIQLIFIALLLFLNIVFKYDSNNVYILLLINFISIFPLPITMTLIEYKKCFNKAYNNNFNELILYRENLSIISSGIKKLQDKNDDRLDNIINEILKRPKRYSVYEEIYPLRRCININSKLKNIFYYTTETHLKLIIATKDYDLILKEIESEKNKFDETMKSIKFNKTDKKWKEELNKINLNLGDKND